MIIKDKKYPNRLIKNWRRTGKNLQFSNARINVNLGDAINLLKFYNDYELLTTDIMDVNNEWIKNNKLIFAGVLGFANGYGKAGMHMVEALSDLSDVTCTSGHWHGYSDQYFTEKLQKIVNKEMHNSALVVQYGLGNSFVKIQQPSIAITMLECSLWPSHWIEHLNNTVDNLIVPCESQRKAVIESGYLGNVSVSPIGVLASVFKKKKVEKNKQFVFGISGNLTFRKGVDVLIRAFEEEFPNDDNVALFLKNGGIPALYWNNNDIGLKEEWKKDPRINIVSDIWSDEELIEQFYSVIDCYVSPSRGEGMGLTTIEAMLCELPVIMSDCSGLREQYKEGCNLLTKTNIVKVPNDTMYGYPDDLKRDNQEWDEPDVADLRKKMRWVYENQKEAEKMGKKARKFAEENLSAESCAKQLIETLNNITNKNV
jgi:glycosyltransferase involved in cell wall biosynthesis